MSLILNIDTSTTVCSVALTAEGMILCHREDFRGRNHAALLSGFIKDCLDFARQREISLDAVAVTLGPGSYTGLRIGLSEAKGLAYALGIPLIGINTLELMTTRVMFSTDDIDPLSIFIPMIDARRMEVFAAAYDFSLQPLIPPAPVILDSDSFASVLRTGRPVLFFGDGSDKAATVINDPLAVHVPDVCPLAVDMVALAERDFAARRFIDLAYSTPLYLKEFQATTPKSRI